MELLRTTTEVEQWRCTMQDASVGFVPTMGALHRGHISLVERAVRENEHSVVSIFVNPTQFDDKADLQRYPRMLEQDLSLLSSTKCSVVFAPSVSEIYPQPDSRVFDFGELDKVMEGSHRRGHFNGVAQVVSRLFEIVCPLRAYFGEKDYQQLVIVRRMVCDFAMPVEVVGCPIVREKDGLAMSSRNALLTSEQRQVAPLIARTLFAAVDSACSSSIQDLIDFVVTAIHANPHMQLDYFQIVNAVTLQPVLSWDESCTKRACIAVRMSSIRLIDNVRIG